MNIRSVAALFLCFAELALAHQVSAQSNRPLKLVQRIPMPGVQGHTDHISVDVKDNRLFVPANGEKQNTVEVIDLRAGKWSVASLSCPAHVSRMWLLD